MPTNTFLTFIEQVYAVIDAKVDDTSFTVDQFAEALSMSRANLHRKLKVATGYSPGYLVHIYRLQKASQLLKEGFNSSQTAYKTGFDSPAYFTKCFREYFGVTPLHFEVI